MKRRFVIMPLLAIAAASFATVSAGAHACEDKNDPSTCEQTPVQPNWRDGNYIPLFDIRDRDDESQRYDAQRWRDECDNGRYDSADYQSRQMCFWAHGGFSVVPNRAGGADQPSPNEWHVGFAATHCFLMEAAHQCEDHEAGRGEGVHDAHGGAMYADICLTENPESKYCDDGLEDTQVGVTIMDHNACGTIIPIVACTDEYHVIRPFDTAYTQEQMEDSAAYIPRIVDDPILYLCGKPEYRGGNPICPGEDDGDGDDAVAIRARADLTSALASAAAGGVDVQTVSAARAMRAARLLAAREAASTGPDGASADVAWAALIVLALAWRVARRTVLG